jgi:hypothetical protein
MAKPNKNRKRLYDAYKAQGRREKNAKRKAALRDKELAKYAARREDSVYQKARTERKKAKDPHDVEPTVVKAERIGGWDSIMGKIRFAQEQEEKEMRRLKAKIEG